MKKLKSQFWEINVNHLLALKIYKRKLKPSASKELLISETFVFINFHKLQKIDFLQTVSFGN